MSPVLGGLWLHLRDAWSITDSTLLFLSQPDCSIQLKCRHWSQRRQKEFTFKTYLYVSAPDEARVVTQGGHGRGASWVGSYFRSGWCTGHRWMLGSRAVSPARWPSPSPTPWEPTWLVWLSAMQRLHHRIREMPPLGLSPREKIVKQWPVYHYYECSPGPRRPLPWASNHARGGCQATVPWPPGGTQRVSVQAALGLVYFSCKKFFSSVQLLSHVRLFATPWTAAHQASLSITNSQSLLKLTSIKSVMPFNPLILCHPLLLLPSIFPSIRVFSNE